MGTPHLSCEYIRSIGQTFQKGKRNYSSEWQYFRSTQTKNKVVNKCLTYGKRYNMNSCKGTLVSLCRQHGGLLCTFAQTKTQTNFTPRKYTKTSSLPHSRTFRGKLISFSIVNWIISTAQPFGKRRSIDCSII